MRRDERPGVAKALLVVAEDAAPLAFGCDFGMPGAAGTLNPSQAWRIVCTAARHTGIEKAVSR